jgi:hypothetical protein
MKALYVINKEDVLREQIREQAKLIMGQKRTITKLMGALERYVSKFGNCGAVYVQAMKVLREGE